MPDTARLQLLLAGVKAATAAIPFAGGSIAEAIGYFGQREIDKRLNRFLDEVIRGLEDARTDIDNLNASFYTTLLHAVEVARRTHQQEKTEALKNAVLNAAKPTAPDDDLQHIFVNMIDDLTPLHLRLLHFLMYPQKFGVDVEDFRGLHTVDHPNNPRTAWDAIEKQVAPGVSRDLIQFCFNDMVNHGLLEYRQMPGAIQGAILPWPTNLAWEFVRFITSSEQQGSGAAPTLSPSPPHGQG